MIQIKTPLIYQPHLASEKMREYLFEWAYVYGPAIKNPELWNIYYRPGLDEDTLEAIDWARQTTIDDPELFKATYKDWNFVKVAGFQLGANAYHHWPLDVPYGYEPFMDFLRNEEDRLQGRFLIAVDE